MAQKKYIFSNKKSQLLIIYQTINNFNIFS
jgi:hypothetical protein